MGYVQRTRNTLAQMTLWQRQLKHMCLLDQVMHFVDEADETILYKAIKSTSHVTNWYIYVYVIRVCIYISTAV